MHSRTAEDQLREEYFSLLPQMRLVADELEAEIRFLLIPITRQWEKHDRVIVKARIKECESAIAALRRRRELWVFDEPLAPQRSLKTLNDLAGCRILAFPRSRVLEIDRAVRERFSDWVADPVPPAEGTTNSLASKYHGYCRIHGGVRAEVQVMSMLVGMFWEVEHGALYKPVERLRGLERDVWIRESTADVIRAMHAFEERFETLASSDPVCEEPAETH
jgi:ppGpp synthetase/RelA/SpoT-type nucleotidyltranferase